MTSLLRAAAVLLLLFTAVTGLAYPLLITGAAQALFPSEANGSPLVVQGRVVGSQLVGQSFQSDGYFWGRPSATSPMPYDGRASSGSNLGPMNPALAERVTHSLEALRASGSAGDATPVPVDLVTASASGLDPHISPASALYQVPRVAAARHLPEAKLRGLVLAQVEGRTWGLLGEPRVNVLALNLALDELTK